MFYLEFRCALVMVWLSFCIILFFLFCLSFQTAQSNFYNRHLFEESTSSSSSLLRSYNQRQKEQRYLLQAQLEHELLQNQIQQRFLEHQHRLAVQQQQERNDYEKLPHSAPQNYQQYVCSRWIIFCVIFSIVFGFMRLNEINCIFCSLKIIFIFILISHSKTPHNMFIALFIYSSNSSNNNNHHIYQMNEHCQRINHIWITQIIDIQSKSILI